MDWSTYSWTWSDLLVDLGTVGHVFWPVGLLANFIAVVGISGGAKGGPGPPKLSKIKFLNII